VCCQVREVADGKHLYVCEREFVCVYVGVCVYVCMCVCVCVCC